MKMTILVIALLITGLLLIFGCTGTAAASPPAASPSQVTNQASVTGSGVNPGGAIVADNKTGYQKTQDTIAAAVAVGYESIGVELDRAFFDIAAKAIPKLASMPTLEGLREHGSSGAGVLRVVASRARGGARSPRR